MTKEIDGLATAYAKTVNLVRGKADAVNASKTDKTIADATRILNDSKGRVKDDKVRAALENAIKSKDGKAISDAVKAVNDSIKAKSDADAKARAEKAKQAADNAAQTQTDNSGSYTGGTTGRIHRIHRWRLHATPGRIRVHAAAIHRWRIYTHTTAAAHAAAVPGRRQRWIQRWRRWMV